MALSNMPEFARDFNCPAGKTCQNCLAGIVKTTSQKLPGNYIPNNVATSFTQQVKPVIKSVKNTLSSVIKG